MLAKIIQDSIAPNGKRLTTMQLRYQRFIHAEFMTHRVFSRNASSSRAIPVAKMIEQVRNDPAMPAHWGKNQAGMQAEVENDALIDLGLLMDHGQGLTAEETWRQAANIAATIAEAMSAAGYHKQVVNRLLEPFQYINVVVTATEWDNFFELRTHKDAQPEFQVLACAMKQAMDESVPTRCLYGKSWWHLPYVQPHERDMYPTEILIQMSAARCARVSYLKHDSTKPNVEDDIALYNRLIVAKPAHASPIEHQAYPSVDANYKSNNFVGWIQYRSILAQEEAINV